MPRDWLFVSDVDDTLLGDDEAVGAFADWYTVAKPFLRLSLNSGRFFDSVRKSVRASGLPEPDAYIGGVGTDICFPPDGQRLAGWPVAAGDWDVRVIRQVCGEFQELESQPEYLLSPYKISYYGHGLDAAYLERLRRRLAEAGQGARVVYSSRRDLDVLPAGANKGTAVAHLAQHWRIDPSRVIVAGDSGNDLDMFQQGFLGIVVGNAHAELKSLRDANVYHARRGYAAGVLEGLRHWLEKQ
ncbi:MAG: HAD-IIB family hydrolase [Pirellulales bacterium]